jgi:hypothetical protein
MWEFSGVCDNLLETTRNSLILKAERCQSGRLSTLGKRVYGKPYQGFESLSLRHSSTDLRSRHGVENGFSGATTGCARR